MLRIQTAKEKIQEEDLSVFFPHSGPFDPSLTTADTPWNAGLRMNDLSSPKVIRPLQPFLEKKCHH